VASSCHWELHAFFGSHTGLRSYAGCGTKTVAMVGTSLCVGPEAPPGELDSNNLLFVVGCLNGTQAPGCQAAVLQFTTETGCSTECLSTLTDSGPRGQLCSGQAAATCTATAVPCENSSASPTTGTHPTTPTTATDPIAPTTATYPTSPPTATYPTAPPTATYPTAPPTATYPTTSSGGVILLVSRTVVLCISTHFTNFGDVQDHVSCIHSPKCLVMVFENLPVRYPLCSKPCKHSSTSTGSLGEEAEQNALFGHT
jgi:hypothetical protein